MSRPPVPLHLAVALEGAGWHPAAWREPDARPADLFTARYWADLVAEAERGLLDLVTLEDSLGLQSSVRTGPDGRTDQVRGRLDAVLTAARIAPLTRHIGLVPVAVVTHTEPFHLSKAVATLDHVSSGRAGVQVRVSATPDEAAHFGRRDVPRLPIAELDSPAGRALLDELFGEAADYVEVVRRLWDSWEDDAEIRDVATGRFIDREKLHYIDFEGRHFKVKGPSITPRPPQGQPVVAALAHRTEPFRLVAGSADLGFTTPHDTAQAASIVAEIRSEQERAGRGGETVHVFGDLVVFLDEEPGRAAERRARLDAALAAPHTGDAQVFAGTAAELADLLADFAQAGLTGFRLRPATLPYDLARITRDLVPELQRRGLFRASYQADTLRGLLGLPRPANRYTPA
ncbi:Flavin-dependent oxidoreductase, luciferase family (includes alkanesulfonate monooxygenase SsuD and methylene tetrahydromethanopterin reductase) [Actinacidiphila yanglinensis]|uniref:Flavin-dependent oxidoreductase, luciferase family (Includes alkanesulfonate monooxygenase SsuD and methylene tetrahydromethanopterin reductase) n=1 Tax=Actinacidiphila yanglinensis TaxID=310779 RepID=A0A1H6B4Z0_9ACTN|nr:LLM class flavin-dependent oxidoreductase [Actinacidiphila yanglinensis]SEG55614.1 Flavin-dependent oxidoreductase, luciferase family (includes alkanesulfonate monooxygenase SsuD and methylene tetrahydromethanopterin reductase) [Actinacidiphila yanglinensis]